MSVIEYYYSAHSVFAYIGAARLTEIAATAGRQVVHKPMHLNAVVAKAHPDGFANRSKAHRNYYFGREIERWAEYRGVEMRMGIPANHSNDTTLANCMLIAASEARENVADLALAVMSGHWQNHADLADEDTLRAIATEAGFSAETLMTAARSDEIKAKYQANTAEAIERSVFGSPTYFVDGEMFYGQDRLELVERALQQPFTRNWPQF